MSCEAAESIKDAILRMARVNCNTFLLSLQLYIYENLAYLRQLWYFISYTYKVDLKKSIFRK